MAGKLDLLQAIQEQQNVLYLSDLHICNFTAKTKKMIKEIPEDSYTLEEWNTAASYILNKDCSLPDIKAAKTAIVERTGKD